MAGLAGCQFGRRVLRVVDRTASVNVDGDATGVVGLRPTDGPNGLNGGSLGASDGRADIQQDQLVINLGGFEDGVPQSRSINANIRTTYDEVFSIRNNGSRGISVTITPNGGHSQYVTLYDTTEYDNASNVTGPNNSFLLIPDEEAVISIEIDLTGVHFGDGGLESGDALIESLTIATREP